MRACSRVITTSCQQSSASNEKHSYEDKALLQAGPRKAFARPLAQGWTDGLRMIRLTNVSTPIGVIFGTVGPTTKGFASIIFFSAPTLPRSLTRAASTDGCATSKGQAITLQPG